MKFSDLNKEQKQLLILAVGGSFTLLMIASNLVMKPAKAAAANAEKVIAELESEVNKGELLLQRDDFARQSATCENQAFMTWLPHFTYMLL